MKCGFWDMWAIYQHIDKQTDRQTEKQTHLSQHFVHFQYQKSLTFDEVISKYNTRRVAVDPATHCSTCSKSARCCHLVSDIEMWTASSNNMPPIAEIRVFQGTHSIQTMSPLKTHIQNIQSLGSWLAIPPPRNYTFLPVFGAWKTSCTEILEIFHWCTYVYPDSGLLFKNGRNRCRISGQKAALHWWQKKNKTCFWRECVP